jgi:hypothetical protein
VGTSDLDEYGSWSAHSDYGHVWYPSHVETNWAPYSDGNWIWQDPYGWTWVDNAPWGFAPSHYGRWVSVDNRWGWVPGPRGEQAVYAPALVAFVGGGGWSVGISVGGTGPIGWFPLGAREIYEPSYRASRDYFTRVNVTNTTINNTTITNVYNNYTSGRPLAQTNYVNRAIPGAVTAVPGNVFANAQPVRAAAIRMDSKQLATAQVTRMAAVAPSARSAIGSASAAKAAPSNAVLERKVVARTAPPAKPVPFAARQQELQRTPGRPLAPSAVAALQPRASATATARNVHVLGPQAGAVNARTAGPAHAAPTAESKVSPHDNAAAQVSKSHASDQILGAPTPPQHHASVSSEPKHKVASPPPQHTASSHVQERSASTSSQQQQHAASAHVQERSASTSSQQHATSAHVQERSASTSSQQHATSAHVQERSASTSSQQKQHATSAHVQERSASTSSQQQPHAASAHVQERSASTSSQQQPHAASAHVQERTASTSSQQQHATSAHVQERTASTSSQQQPHAASAHVQERTASTSSQQQQHATSGHVQEPSASASSQQQPHATSAHVQERSVAAAPQQHNAQPSPPQHNAPAVQQKAKATNKKDDSKDANKKDDSGNRGNE